MANVIEILIAANDQASATLQKVAAEAGALNTGVTQSFLAAGGAVAAFGLAAGAAVGGIVALTKSYIDHSEQLNLLSGRVGISTENVQVLQKSMEALGLSADSGTTALTFLTRAIGNNSPVLDELGVKGRDTWSVFTQLVTIFSKMDDVSTRNADAIKLFGRGGAELLGVIDRLGPTMGEMRTQMEQVGALMSPEMIHKSEDLKKELVLLQNEWAGLLLKMGPDILAVAMDAIHAFETLASRIDAVVLAVRHFFQMLGQKPPNDTDTDPLANFIGPRLGNMQPLDPNFIGPQIGPWGTQSTFTPAAVKSWFDAMDPEVKRQIEAFSEFTTPEWKKVLKETFVQSMVDLGPEVKAAALQMFEPLDEIALQLAQNVGHTLTNGLASIFTSIATQAQTFGQVMKQIFDKLVADIAGALAQLAERNVLGPLFSALGLAIGGPVGAFVGSIFGGAASSSASRVAGSFAGAGAGGNTFVIQAIDSKTALDSILSATGGIRRANDRLAEIARAAR